jgi:hypothetical protein
MYTLLESVVCVILVAGAVAALITVGWACVALVQFVYRAAPQIGRLLPRPSTALLRLGSPLFNGGDNLVAVRVTDREKRGRISCWSSAEVIRKLRIQ